MSDQEIRVPVLLRLVEQAMTDMTFREIAREDLDLALREGNYDLNDRERSLVHRFRDALNAAGVDVLLQQASSKDVGQLFEDVGPEGIEEMLNASLPHKDEAV